VSADRTAAVPARAPALNRGFAAAAGLAAVIAGACLSVAAVRTPGYSAADYLSELGVGAAPRSALYRVAVLYAALGVGMLGGALRRVRLVSGFLLVSAALFVGSASVTCTPGCPLPPHNPDTTLRDVFHAGTSAGALGFAGLAMLALAARWPDRLVAAVSRVAGWLMVGLIAAAGTALLVQSAGLANGMLERAVVAVALGWLLVVSVAVAIRPAPD